MCARTCLCVYVRMRIEEHPACACMDTRVLQQTFYIRDLSDGITLSAASCGVGGGGVETELMMFLYRRIEKTYF